MAAITFDRVEKRYPNGFMAVRDLSLEIADGELLVLVGPSGSGKSTALRMIAGLEPVTSGRILIGDRDVTALPPQARDLAMVFQSYALYPHMTVRDNLAFGLSVRGRDRREIDERIGVVARALELGTLLDRKPAQLSGGQRQRVALGRAMVREPLAFLFDEPLSNLDARLRVETRAELARLHRRLATTMVYVTHDQVEAMTLGTRVAVMHDGRLQQVAPPMILYREPENLFVAGFIGSPAMNLLRGQLTRDDGVLRFTGGGLTMTIPTALARQLGALAGDVVLGIRPQRLSLVAPDAPSAWPGTVWLVESHGDSQVVHLEAGEVADVVVVVPPDHAVRNGDVVGIAPDSGALHLFDAATGRAVLKPT